MPANPHTARETQTPAAGPSTPADLHDFERIYELYGARVYRLCLRMVGNTADAEELTQDTFLQVFRRLDTYRGESAFSTWLHRVAVNTVLMRLRKNRGRQEAALDRVAETEEGEEIQTTEARVEDPRLLATIDRLSLERAILRLPVRQRLVFVLHDVEGYTHEEIAGLAGCTVESSKYQTHTARLNLRALLQDYERENAMPAQAPVVPETGAEERAKNGRRARGLPVEVPVEG